VTGSANDQAYSKFYSALKASRRFELVSTPAQADLIFETWLSGAVYAVYTRCEKEGVRRYETTTAPNSFIKLVVWDRRMRTTLLVVNQDIDVRIGTLSRTIDKRFSKATAALVSDAETAFAASGTKSDLTQVSLPRKLEPAPLPSQIASGGKVYVTKPGEGRVYPSVAAGFLYDYVVYALRGWGRYQLVTKVADADLVLEPSVAGGLLRLSIRDPQTSVVLWAFNSQASEDLLEPPEVSSTIHSASEALMNNLRGLDGRANRANAGLEAAGSANGGNVPVPPLISAQLTAARKIFLSNEARDRPGYDHEDNDLVLEKVRRALKAWGKYEFVQSAAEADLVFDPSIQDMNVQLAVMNAKAGGRVWTSTQEAQKAVFYTSRQRNIGNAATALMDDLRKAEAQSDAGVTARELLPQPQ
jgi:hypothetical protein